MSSFEDVGVIFWSGHPEDKFFWTLPNCFGYYEYNGYEEKGKISRSGVVCSPLFVSFDIKWRLALIKNIQRDCIGLFLWKISNNCFSNLTVKLGVEKAGDKGTIEGKLKSNDCFGQWNYVKSNMFSLSKTEYSEGGMIRVFCKIRSNTVDILDVPLKNENEKNKQVEDKHEEQAENKVPESKGVDRLMEDLKSLLLNGLNSDVILKIQEREFKVHRNIMMIRSPVFASMLQHDTKENATGIVDIPDCTAEAFEAFLSYIYTGKADSMSPDNIFDIYYAADKYQINDLKFECAEYMEEKLSIQNFCAIMTLSLKHSEVRLQKKATEFFCSNLKTIIKTVEWQNYVKDYPIQANELFIKSVNA